VNKGLLSAAKVKEIFTKYPENPTPEDIEAVRLEILSEAFRGLARNDPRVKEILAAEGIDPDAIGI